MALGAYKVRRPMERPPHTIDRSAALSDGVVRFRMVGQPLEPRDTEHMLEGGLAGPHRMNKMCPGRVGFLIHHSDKVARTGRRVRPQCVTQFGLRETARETPHGRRPHSRESGGRDKVHRRRSGCLSTLRDPSRKQVGDSGLGRNIESL
jgi:hypothetical protein